MLGDVAEYQRFVYSIQYIHPSIRQSTLTLVLHGAAFAELSGTLLFDKDIRLEVWEDIDFADSVILGYSYSISRGAERLYWYDPQPHPHIPELAATHPHHKHIPPNIKRNRVIAPGISFTSPNLPFLILEIERELLSLSE